MGSLKNIHPGEILFEEFLVPLNITAYRLAKDIDIPQTRVSEIIKGNRRITADTALRLSRYFGNSPKFWLFFSGLPRLSPSSASTAVAISTRSDTVKSTHDSF